MVLTVAEAEGLGGRHKQVARLSPSAQVQLAGGYSVGATLVYCLLGAGLEGSRVLPGPWFYTYSILLYAFCWWSFPLQRLWVRFRRSLRSRALLRWLRQRYLSFVRAVSAVSWPEVPSEIESETPGKLLHPTSTEVAAGDRVRILDSVRVLGLGVGVIVQAAWLTTYSGGPFESPYSQVFISIAILAPTIALRKASITVAYVTTTVVAFVVHVWAPKGDIPGSDLFVATTIALIILSFGVAFLARVGQETAESLVRENHEHERHSLLHQLEQLYEAMCGECKVLIDPPPALVDADKRRDEL